MSKHDESMAALYELDRKLLAGEIDRSEHTVRCNDLLATMSGTLYAHRMGILSGEIIIVLVLAVLWIGMLFFGNYVESFISLIA